MSNLKADSVFGQLSKVLSSSPELVKNVKGRFLFQITKGGAVAGEYHLDCTSPSPSISSLSTQKPDVTIKISDENFILLAEQKLNSMAAFTQGKLKVSGKIMLAQKLGDLFKAYQKPKNDSIAKPVLPKVDEPSEGPLDTLKATTAFKEIETKIESMPEIVSKLKGTFLFQITKDSKIKGEWFLNFNKSPVTITYGPALSKPDVTIKVSDDDFILLALGKINPMQAFMQGKLKATGKIMLAQKLGDLFKSQQSKL